MEGLGGGRDDDVDQTSSDGRDDRRLARALRWVLGLLVDRDAGVPAPVDEDRQQHRAASRASRDIANGFSQPSDGWIEPGGAWGPVHLDEGDDGVEDREDDDLGAEQAHCWVRAESSIPMKQIARHHDDPGDADDVDPEAIRRLLLPNSMNVYLPAIWARDGMTMQVGDEDRPSRRSSRVIGPDRPRRPRRTWCPQSGSARLKY